MRSLADMDTIQIEITNMCHRDCSNCTRFCGHRVNSYMMSKEDFIQALDSLKGFPHMVGIMGGEPLLHPKFKHFCELALERFPRSQLGLWTALPEGLEKYGPVIVETFGNVFFNDHSRDDIYHAPILIGSGEIYKDPREMYYVTDKCWLQNAWSASVNPNGAFFCEIAAALSLLYDMPETAWPVEPGWWWRTPKDFREQIETFCPMCGVALPFARRRSTDGLDDISPEHLERLKAVGSKKIADGKYVLSNLEFSAKPEQMAAYKDNNWRNRIAARYGISLTINSKGFWEPHLRTTPVQKPLYEQLKERYAIERGQVPTNVSRECRGAPEEVQTDRQDRQDQS